MALGKAIMRSRFNPKGKLSELLNDPILERTDLAEIAAKAYTSELISSLMDMFRDDTNPINIRVKIALELLSRGWGRPAVAIRISNDKDKDNVMRTIEGELAAAEETSRQIMELAKMGGNSKFWLEPTSKALEVLGYNPQVPHDAEDQGTEGQAQTETENKIG